MEKGNGYPLQYSCLENPFDRGAWQATVHTQGLKESDTTWRLNNNSNSIHVVWITGYSYLRAHTSGHSPRAQLVSCALHSSSGQVHFLRFPFLKKKQRMMHVYRRKQRTVDHISALKTACPEALCCVRAKSLSHVRLFATPGL